ncbi:MAG: hypothetical protein ACRD8A_14635 [Candidatus Acidiferrales bacterium]
MTEENKIVNPNRGAVKKRENTPAQTAAGAANLQTFLESTSEPPALRSGAFSKATKAGRLPKRHRRLQRLLDEFYAGWIADLGGEQNLTASKRAILWTARGCLAVFALGLEHMQENGLVNAQGDVQPVAKIIGSYANTMRLNLVALGLERTPRNVGKTLEARLQEIAESEAENDNGTQN